MTRRLQGPAEALGLRFGPGEAAVLAAYCELALAWGRRLNLTGARTFEALVDDHLADAVALAAHVPPEARSLVDVGSGAGLPGIVLATLRPETRCVLLEPRERRWAFLREARRLLPIDFEPRLERLEDHTGGPYDVAVSRATWPLPVWLERGRALVAPGGWLLGLEGREPGELPVGAARHPYRLERRRGAVVVVRP